MFDNPFSIQGKTVLVTGASSGIGASIAITLSNWGANVIITGRNEERLYKTFCTIGKNPNNMMITADLTQRDNLDKLTATLPCIDGIILCAGIVKTSPVKNISDKAIDEIFEINTMSNIRLCQRILKSKKINKDSSVVFISSVSTFNVKIGNSLYSATKGAINSFAKAMALELAPRRIRVNVIQPGFIHTGLLNSGIITDEQIEEYIAKHPLGVGEASDIANLCIYLLSDASRWMTGSILTIDGGLTLR